MSTVKTSLTLKQGAGGLSGVAMEAGRSSPLKAETGVRFP
jgi:hypothetical protein